MAPLVDPREKADKGLSSLNTPGDRFAYWLSQISSPFVVGLGVFGYVINAKSGAEGLTIARERPTDLVILDVMMPDLNGFEVPLTSLEFKLLQQFLSAVAGDSLASTPACLRGDSTLNAGRQFHVPLHPS